VGLTRAIGGLAALLASAGALAAGPALAQDEPGATDPGGFRNILPGGQGETVNASELAAFTTTGARPNSFTDQLPQYRDLVPVATSLRAEDLDTYFKSASFEVPSGEGTRTIVPRAGVTIVRDRFDVPHVYGTTRENVAFGAGYASAEDRLFLMDVLRHLGRARSTELIGPGANDANVRADANQLRASGYSEQELQAMIDTGARDAGPEGQEMLRDIEAFSAGINQYIAEARADTSKMPAEYAALGKSPGDWRPTDSVAIASLIGGDFSPGGGAESRAAEVLNAAIARFGERRGRQVFRDFRRREDRESSTTTQRRFPFDDPGRVDRRAVAIPDPGSVRPRDPVVDPGTGPRQSSADVPDWLEALSKLDLSAAKSNALLVNANRSTSGRPLAVMGPQVGYFSPQILMELDLHGPGYDARGAAFPGISLYVLLGRGRDYAWSATTAYGDHQDEFVERLCEPDGSTPTLASRHYVYKGRCLPFETREHVLQTTTNPTSPTTQTRRIVMEVERSVHGPIQSRATVRGEPVAIARARSTFMHELDSTLAFKRLTGSEVTDARSFLRTMATIRFSFNWFYVDDRDIAYLHSGNYPRRARGVHPDFPTWGTGEWDWQGFDPVTYRARRLPVRRLPQEINPRRGYFVNWNNKQAPGWRAADSVWTFSSVHRVERLQQRVATSLRGRRKLDLAELTRIMADAATVDLRGQEVYPWIRRAIGRVEDGHAADMLRLLDAWAADGAHRRDLDGDNVYEHSAAVLIMDAWWSAMTRRMFEPVLGVQLVDRIRTMIPFDSPAGPNGSAYWNGWWGYVEKDLRRLLRRPVRDPLSRVYCGRGSRVRCRQVLLGTLLDARRRIADRMGTDMSRWEKPATCPVRTPPQCDQIVFTTAGAVSTPPIPWQDRPTFQQVVEVQGHRPR
jgi:acyl-homoserine lactone acylase PvdQ